MSGMCGILLSAFIKGFLFLLQLFTKSACMPSYRDWQMVMIMSLPLSSFLIPYVDTFLCG